MAMCTCGSVSSIDDAWPAAPVRLADPARETVEALLKRISILEDKVDRLLTAQANEWPPDVGAGG